MKPLKVLIAHNFYQNAGGEDRVFFSEKALLQSYGHKVIEYTDTNDRLKNINSLNAGIQTLWSKSSYQSFKKLIGDEKPDIVHFHNTFLLISPSAYYACCHLGVPVVQTLHNYRLLCPSAIFFRAATICEECLGKTFAWPGILHRCYRNSRSQSALVATFLSFHRFIRTWQEKVDIFIALSEFSRQKFVEGGIPINKLVVKPNFVQDNKEQAGKNRDYALYVGRLSKEKGVDDLLAAFRHLKGIPLKVVGDGPMRDLVEKHLQESIHGEFLGYQEPSQVQKLMKSARFVIAPSSCYENFPLVMLEAFSNETPVIASRLGAIAEIIHDGETGILFEPGNEKDLADKAAWLWNHPREGTRMGKNARQRYVEKYTPERNYQLLMDIYSKVLKNKAKQ